MILIGAVTSPGTAAPPAEEAAASVELFELETIRFGDKAVRALVEFGAEQEPALRGAVGSRIAFEGTLVKVDGFTKNLFVAHGSWAADADPC